MGKIVKFFLKIVFLVLAITSILSCENLNKMNDASQKSGNGLKLLHKYKLKIHESSGLSLSFDNNRLWVVSDNNSRVYQISLKGKIKHSFKISQMDLEGITVVNSSMLAVVSEKSNTITLLDNKGKELRFAKLNLDKKSNSGVEGVAYNSKNGHFFIIKEKHQGLLLELGSNLKEISRVKLNFAKDYSGLFYDKINNRLWILSDENRLLAECDLKGNAVNT